MMCLICFKGFILDNVLAKLKPCISRIPVWLRHDTDFDLGDFVFDEDKSLFTNMFRDWKFQCPQCRETCKIGEVKPAPIHVYSHHFNGSEEKNINYGVVSTSELNNINFKILIKKMCEK